MLCAHTTAAQTIGVASPGQLTYTFTPGLGTTGGGELTVAGKFGAIVPFKFGGVGPLTPSETVPDFVIVSPSSGVTPALVGVVLNGNVIKNMTPGTYRLGVTFLPLNPASDTDKAVGIVTLRIFSPPPPSINAVVNAATLQPDISPGQLVSIFGANLGALLDGQPLLGDYSDGGVFPTALGNSTVTFNGVSAPLFYVGRSQINCVVPFGVAGQKSVNVVVTRTYDTSHPSPPFSVPLVGTSPGIFTTAQNGMGQGAILNVHSENTFNSVSNPAPQGSAITLFATGAGLWNASFPDGSLVLGDVYQTVTFQPPSPAGGVSLTIGGQPAKLLYAAIAPGQVWGFLQINAIIPTGIGSGPQPVVLKIGDNDNSQQKVTVAVQ